MKENAYIGSRDIEKEGIRLYNMALEAERER
jgi:hypothetical protein